MCVCEEIQTKNRVKFSIRKLRSSRRYHTVRKVDKWSGGEEKEEMRIMMNRVREGGLEGAKHR
jgi:hypothetical protein